MKKLKIIPPPSSHLHIRLSVHAGGIEPELMVVDAHARSQSPAVRDHIHGPNQRISSSARGPELPLAFPKVQHGLGHHQQQRVRHLELVPAWTRQAVEQDSPNRVHFVGVGGSA